jgi:preprotein translocase subunit SecF
MFKKEINFNKCFKPVLIGYAIFMAIGIILTCIFGVNLDINFKGGTRITYSYTGELDYKSTEALIEKTLGKDVDVSESSGLADDSKKIVITLVGTDSLSNEAQQNLAKTLTKEYKDNTFELYDSNSVNPSVAGAFFAKSIAAVVLTLLDYLIVKFTGLHSSPFGKGFVGFMLSVVILYITQYFVAGYTISWMAAIIGALIYGIIDYFIPGEQQIY